MTPRPGYAIPTAVALLLEVGLVLVAIGGFLLSERTARDGLVVAGATGAVALTAVVIGTRLLPMRPSSLTLHLVVLVATFAAGRHFFADDSNRSATVVLVAVASCVALAMLLVSLDRTRGRA